LVSQRNPFEVYLLLVGAVLGSARLMFGFKTSSVIDGLDPVVLKLWSWLVTSGCIVGLIGLSLPKKWIEVGLQLERYAMTIVGGGLLVYAGIVYGQVGSAGLWTASTNGAFALACLTRSVQISRRFHWADSVEARFEHRFEERR
jgi:hypothetical protein